MAALLQFDTLKEIHPVLNRQLKITISTILLLSSSWALGAEVATGKGDLYSESDKSIQLPLDQSPSDPEKIAIPNNAEPTVFIQPASQPLDGSISSPVAVIAPAPAPTPAENTQPPIESKPFTLSAGDFVTATKKTYQFYKLDRKGRPTKIRKLPAGIGFKVIKPNKTDTRVQFLSGPMKGQQAFIKRSAVEEILKADNSSDTAPASATIPPGPNTKPPVEKTKAPSTHKVEVAPEAIDEGDETGLVGTVPDDSPEAVAAILRDCKECTKRDLKSTFPDKLVDAGKKVVKTVTLQKFKYIDPIPGARVTSPYGYRKHPLLGYRKLHAGMDFAGNSKTPIKASREGKIIFMGKKGGYGNIIIIKHSDGFTTRYAHMSKFAKGLKKGMAVEQGQWLGNVGATGKVTGPHLHFEIRDAKGRPQPPTKYLGK